MSGRLRNKTARALSPAEIRTAALEHEVERLNLALGEIEEAFLHRDSDAHALLAIMRIVRHSVSDDPKDKIGTE